MLYGPMDPNERFRARRDQTRRTKRRRRAAVLAFLLLIVIALVMGARFVGDNQAGAKPTRATAPVAQTAVATRPRPLPVEIRGVHVTAALASLSGKFKEYVDYKRYGLNTIELDVKDEAGEIGFATPNVPLARKVGANRLFYNPKAMVALAHRNGIYMIGRVVCFQDPTLARERPDLAIERPDGSVWTTSAGLGWVNPYDRRVWDYCASVAQAAADAGFDQIMFDYVRFPSDGDVERAVYGSRGSLAKREAIPAFLRYANRRLDPFGVRLSAAVFGLSAARDLGIGQIPRRMAPYLDTVYAMTYPSLFGNGELGLQDPSRSPGATVARALRKFELALRGRRALVVPWVQDFSFTVPYGIDEVRAQIDAARLSGAKGYMLWNAECVYTDGALAPT